jgi:hypothetical protein
MNEKELLTTALEFVMNGDMTSAVRLLNKHGKQELSLIISQMAFASE